MQQGGGSSGCRGAWGPWSPCSMGCRGGVKVRIYAVPAGEVCHCDLHLFRAMSTIFWPELRLPLLDVRHQARSFLLFDDEISLCLFLYECNLSFALCPVEWSCVPPKSWPERHATMPTNQVRRRRRSDITSAIHITIVTITITIDVTIDITMHHRHHQHHH